MQMCSCSVKSVLGVSIMTHFTKYYVLLCANSRSKGEVRRRNKLLTGILTPKDFLIGKIIFLKIMGTQER